MKSSLGSSHVIVIVIIAVFIGAFIYLQPNKLSDSIRNINTSGLISEEEVKEKEKQINISAYYSTGGGKHTDLQQKLPRESIKEIYDFTFHNYKGPSEYGWVVIDKDDNLFLVTNNFWTEIEEYYGEFTEESIKVYEDQTISRLLLGPVSRGTTHLYSFDLKTGKQIPFSDPKNIVEKTNFKNVSNGNYPYEIITLLGYTGGELMEASGVEMSAYGSKPAIPVYYKDTGIGIFNLTNGELIDLVIYSSY